MRLTARVNPTIYGVALGAILLVGGLMGVVGGEGGAIVQGVSSRPYGYEGVYEGVHVESGCMRVSVREILVVFSPISRCIFLCARHGIGWAGLLVRCASGLTKG